MKSRRLSFRTFELFRTWYTSMKTKFRQLACAFIKWNTSERRVMVVITY